MHHIRLTLPNNSPLPLVPLQCKLHCTHVTEATRKAPVTTFRRRQVHQRMVIVSVARKNTTLFIVHMLTVTVRLLFQLSRWGLNKLYLTLFWSATTFMECNTICLLISAFCFAPLWPRKALLLPLSSRAPKGIFSLSICWDYITVTIGMYMYLYMCIYL